MGTINIKNIKLDDCACPKLGEKVTKPNPCITENMGYVAGSQVSDGQVFKVKNLFGELKSDWQKAEARKNLKVPEILRFTQTKIGEGPNDENIWEMVTSTGGNEKIYQFVVKNGKDGVIPNVRIGKVTLSEKDPEVTVSQTDKEIVLNFSLPMGLQGENGQDGKDGTSITKVTMYYTLSESKNNPPQNEWTSSLQTPEKDRPYLWAYIAFTSTDNKTIKTSPFILREYQVVNPGGGTVELLQTITTSTTQAVSSKAIYNALEEKADIAKFGKINGTDIYNGGDITIQASGIVDSVLKDDSENAVQNKVITEAINDLRELIQESPGGNIDVDSALDEDSSNPLTNSTITRELAKCIKPSQLVTINGRQLYDPQSPTNDILIGDGFEASIKVCGENDTPNANLCFFQQRPLQGVALYNDLLQNGSVTGTDGNTYVYNPSTLYHLYDDGSFITLEDSRDAGHWVDDYKGFAQYKYIDNEGNIQSQITSLPYYGRVIPGARVLYAMAGDTAYGQLRVGGPFYAEVTEVTVEYDQSKIDMYEVTSVKKQATQDPLNNPPKDYEYIYQANKTLIPNGAVLKFGYSKKGDIRTFYDNILIIYERKWNNPNELKTSISVPVTFKTIDDERTINVKFGETQILYKSGNIYTTQKINGQSMFQCVTTGRDLNDTTQEKTISFLTSKEQAQAAGVDTAYVGYGSNANYPNGNTGLKCLRFSSGNQYIILEKNVTIDQTKYNIVYVKLHNILASGYTTAMYIVGRLKGWISQDQIAFNDYYKSTTVELKTAMGQIPLYGEYPLICPMQDYNYSGHKTKFLYNGNDPANTDVITLDEIIFRIKNNCGSAYISEIGIIKHKAPFEDDSK